jgi:hypothetical protein
MSSTTVKKKLIRVKNIKSIDSSEELVVEENVKKEKGQFYTVNNEYILDGLDLPPDNCDIIEPFAGQGDLINWLKGKNIYKNVEMYDVDPKIDGIIKRDTLKNPPNYENKWIITNPPYLARNKTEYKEVFDMYNTNDLYKCFLTSITNQKSCKGGILIIPVGFFLSPRDIDVVCRNSFMSKYKITKVKYFEEKVFPDTSTTVIAFSFEQSSTILEEQDVVWEIYPNKEVKTFNVKSSNNWIIGGDIYNLPINTNIKIRRYVKDMKLKKDEQLTNLTLLALDSGKEDGRIKLEYKKDYVYEGKNTSRTYATICILGKTLSPKEQSDLAVKFNSFLESKRKETHSLFLPQYRESIEYARKRIPFDLAYSIILHLLR